MSEGKKKGLGRGLSALFGDQKKDVLENENNSKTQNFALIGDLDRNRFQPRINFDENKISELSNSIKKNGLIQPIVVRPHKYSKGKYEIIAGERRWIAAKSWLTWSTNYSTKSFRSRVFEVAIVENIQREDLNIIEEGKYERLKNEFRYDNEKIASMMSKSKVM